MLQGETKNEWVLIQKEKLLAPQQTQQSESQEKTKFDQQQRQRQ